MRSGKFLSIFFVILLIFSCATAPEEEVTVPGWFLNPPQDTDEIRYFTISLETKPTEDIEQKAGEQLYQEVVRSIGISASVAMLEDFAEIRDQIISVSKEGSAEGFKLIEKQINDNETGKVLYILVQMEKSQDEELQQLFDKILKVNETANIYSNDAEELIAKGEVYDGVISYLTAALETAGTSNEFVGQKNLTAAAEALEDFVFEPLEKPESLSVGEVSVFSAELSSKSELDNIIWKNTPVRVSFLDRKKGGVIGNRIAELRSDENGKVLFVHPSPGFTGSGRVQLSLDLQRDFGSLEKLEESYPQEYETFSQVLNGISVYFDFEIVSSAHQVPTAVYIVDSDFLRKPLDTDNTAQGILAGLEEADFDVEVVPLDRDLFMSQSDVELLRDLPYMVAGDQKRLIFGIAQITEFDDSAAGFTVVTEATIRVIDLDSGEIFFEESLSKRVQGGESQATINTSFKELGKSFSTLLIDKLP